jgi:DNA-binding NtrC family response regulator
MLAKPPLKRSERAASSRPPGEVRSPLARETAPLIILIESDAAQRAEMRKWLGNWGLRVVEADLESAMPARDEHIEAAAIIADYELGASTERAPALTGLDIALLIARRAARRVPTLVTSDNFGRNAIPACSQHRFPVMFKPVSAEHLRSWLQPVLLLADAPEGSAAVETARGAA